MALGSNGPYMTGPEQDPGLREEASSPQASVSGQDADDETGQEIVPDSPDVADFARPPRSPGNLETGPSTVSALLAAVGQFPNPGALRLDKEHITEIISQRGRRSDQEHFDRKQSRLVWLFFACFVILVVTAIIIFMTLYEEPDLLREILFGVGGLITGLGAGFGLAETRRR